MSVPLFSVQVWLIYLLTIRRRVEITFWPFSSNGSICVNFYEWDPYDSSCHEFGLSLSFRLKNRQWCMKSMWGHKTFPSPFTNSNVLPLYYAELQCRTLLKGTTLFTAKNWMHNNIEHLSPLLRHQCTTFVSIQGYSSWTHLQLTFNPCKPVGIIFLPT